MPFKSEAQRKYLWANEPEIARDWTDTYGSRIQRDEGGIMRVPFRLGEEVEDSTTIDIDDNTRQAKVNTQQQTIISNQLRQGKSLQEIFDAAKQFDSLFRGMTKEEFNNFVKEREKNDSTWQGSPVKYGTLAQADDEFANIEGYTARKPARFNTMSDAYTGDALDRSEFIDDANYIPKWSEYTDDPEYDDPYGFDRMNEEKYGDVYNQGMKFGDADTLQEYFANNPQFYQGIAQNLGRGIGKTRDALGNIYQGGKSLGMQGLNMLGGAYQLAKGAFPLSLLFNAGSTFSNLRGGHPTQNAYEQARHLRRLQGRKDYMMDRRAQGLGYGKENLEDVFRQLGQTDTWKPPAPKVPPTYIHQPTGPQQQNGGGGIPSVARDLGMTGSYAHGWT